MIRKVCPFCHEQALQLALGCFYRRTVELACQSCQRTSPSHIPNAAWWTHRLLFAILATLLVPFLFLFAWEKWSVWGLALLLLAALGALSHLALHLWNCNRMLLGRAKRGVGAYRRLPREERLRELASELTDLRAFKPASKEEVASWYELARKLEGTLVEKGGLSPEVPSLLWNYLADADIRFKSQEFAAQQDRQISLLVRYLQRGEMPTSEELKRYG